MKYDRYTVESSHDFLRHEFVSEGPRGRVEKRVEFEEMFRFSTLYNLTLGDMIEDKLDDMAVTDNSDQKKVLATVGFIVFEFLKRYPAASVYMKGSNAVRNRLYRMTISNNLEILEVEFILFGFVDEEPYRFERNGAYDGFMVRKRNNLA